MPCYDAYWGTAQFGYSSWGTICPSLGDNIPTSITVAITKLYESALTISKLYSSSVDSSSEYKSNIGVSE